MAEKREREKQQQEREKQQEDAEQERKVEELEKMEAGKRREHMIKEAINSCEILIKREEEWLKLFEGSLDNLDPAVLPHVKEWMRRLKKNIEDQRRILEFTRNNESVTEGNLVVMMRS